MALVLMPCNLKHSSFTISNMGEKIIELLLQCTLCLYCNWKHTKYSVAKSVCSEWSFTQEKSKIGNIIDHAAFITVTLSFTTVFMIGLPKKQCVV